MGRLAGYMRQNAVACLALFVALGGTGAYAANTIATGDIIDNQVTSADVRDDNLGFGGLTAKDLGPGSVGNSEVADFSLGNGDFLTGSVDGRVATNNSLIATDFKVASVTGADVGEVSGADINESTLVLPPTMATATFALTTQQGGVPSFGSFVKVTGKTVPAGSYAITATVNATLLRANSGNDVNSDTACELRNGGGFIGGTRDRRTEHGFQENKVSLTMNGGAEIPAGGREISIWCSGQQPTAFVAQIMMLKLNGFS